MRWIFWYIGSCMCRHDWEFEEAFQQTEFRNGLRVSATCKKCGWHRRYWKY